MEVKDGQAVFEIIDKDGQGTIRVIMSLTDDANSWWAAQFKAGIYDLQEVSKAKKLRCDVEYKILAEPPLSLVQRIKSLEARIRFALNHCETCSPKTGMPDLCPACRALRGDIDGLISR